MTRRRKAIRSMLLTLHTVFPSEAVLHGELPDARRRAGGQRRDPPERVRVVDRDAGVARIEMVGDVDPFRPYLESTATANGESAHERLIPLPEARPQQIVVRRIAERAGGWLRERGQIQVPD